MSKIYILDTNVFLHDPKSIFSFQDNEIIIPLVVLDELDKKKQGHDETARHARMVIRSLDKMRLEGSIHEGVSTKAGGSVRVELNHRDKCPPDLDPNKVDNRLISVALGLMEDNPNKKVTLITKDINLRVKCDALNVRTEDYNADSVAEDPSAIYSGAKTILVPSTVIDRLYRDSFVEADGYGKFCENEYVCMRSDTNIKHSALARCNKSAFVKIKTFGDVWGISSKNKEQAFALDALFDPNIKLVTIIGKAGSGKTLVSAAAGVSQVLDSRTYRKLIMARPIQPLGRDIGYLPGPQPLDAKILTPNGWVTMGQIKVGDEVIGRDGKPTKVVGVYPKGKKKIYKITTTNGQCTECCIDHLWKTRTKEEKKRNKPGKIRTTGDILNTIVDKNGKFNHHVPRNSPVEFNKKELLIPPYTMGALLGDGSFSHCVCLSNIDSEIIDRVSTEVSDLGVRLTKNNTNINYTMSCDLYNNKPARKVKITNIKSGKTREYGSIGKALEEIDINRSTLNSRCDNERTIGDFKYEFIDKENRWQNKIKNEIFNLGLSGTKSYTKFIPRIYMESSVDDRVSLLQGLMDTDGTIKRSGESSFCTTSKQLAEDVAELVRSLGGNANIRLCNRIGQRSSEHGRKIVSKRVTYEFTISLPHSINPFYTKRKAKFHKCTYIFDAKIKSVTECGEKEVQCIMVENPEHLYITDDYIVTHNTIDDKLAPWMAPLQDNLELLFSDKGNNYLDMQRESGVIQVEALTYIRGRSIPKSFIIIDEAQNLTNHEVKTIITRVGEGSKVVLTGDILQIDNPFIDSVDNGLSCIVEKFKDNPIAAHITLQKGERSELATLAAEIL